MIHAGAQTRTQVNIKYFDSESIEANGVGMLEDADAILVPGEDLVNVALKAKLWRRSYARENGIPYLGICLGMQVAVIDFARNVAGLSEAHSTEFSEDTPNPVIALDYRMERA